MKKVLVGLLALTLTVWIVGGTQAFAQQSDSQQNQTNQNQANANGSQNMSGRVSSSGKNFTNDKDSKSYKVDNPEALKGHEGEHVAVIVHVDPDTGVIHILQTAVPDQQ
jgi:uncharacterized protein YxeA